VDAVATELVAGPVERELDAHERLLCRRKDGQESLTAARELGGRSVEAASGLGEGPPGAVPIPWVGANCDLERQLGQAACAAAAALAG
jgi:hypothetical protein